MKFRAIHIASTLILTAFIFTAACTGSSGQSNSKISGCIEDLYSDDKNTVTSAVKELAANGETAVNPLINVFSSGNRQASGYAAVALVYIGEPAIEPLTKKLGSDDENERDWASNTLALMGSNAVPDLIDIINTGSGTEKEQAEITLIKIGEPALPLLNLELKTNTEADQDEIIAIIRSIEATQNLQEKLNYTADAASV